MISCTAEIKNRIVPGEARSSIASAEKFLLSCIRSGLAHSYDVTSRRWVKPYPEVTGYLLSYFADEARNGDVPAQILEAAARLIRIQDPCGGFPSFSNRHMLYTFDTAQIMHGLVSLYKRTGTESYLDRAIACAGFVCSMQLPDGSMFPVYDLRARARYAEKTGTWGTSLSPIQVKNIEGLLLLSELSGEARYRLAAEKLALFGRRNCTIHLTHPMAYCLEGLAAIGEMEFVRDQLKDKILPRLHPSGFLAYSPELPYAYVSGSVQMAMLLFKAGFKEESGQILAWARGVQSRHDSGGLFQYADAEGNLDHHVHTEINSWGTKYFCQLERLWSDCG
ncbi:MAG: prenyltransferase/squalene oxidase repeat-containing protein [bacterium]